MVDRVRVGVLASGRGSNYEALVAAGRDPGFPAQVVAVATDRPGAPVLDRAAAHDIPAQAIPVEAPRGRLPPADETAFVAFLRQHRVDLVCLAGFMRILRGPLFEAFPNAILNIHPSLLPAFPGLDAARQALEYGVRVSGCTVHLVDRGIDSGPILIQRAVPVYDDDDASTLAARILEQEHRAYPDAVRLWSTRAWRVDGRRILWETPEARQLVSSLAQEIP